MRDGSADTDVDGAAMTKSIQDTDAELAAAFRREDWLATLEIRKGDCDTCGRRPHTHRHDMYGIETWVCDECAEREL